MPFIIQIACQKYIILTISQVTFFKKTESVQFLDTTVQKLDTFLKFWMLRLLSLSKQPQHRTLRLLWLLRLLRQAQQPKCSLIPSRFILSKLKEADKFVSL